MDLEKFVQRGQAAQKVVDEIIEKHNAPSSADLQRWFCEPWCPKCGFVFDEGQHEKPRTGGVQCETMALPGLHTRDPRTKVEGLEWHGGDWWFVNLQGAGRIRIPTLWAARLLVAGVMWPDMHPPKALPAFARIVYELMRERGISYPEAVAVAYHRALDSEEANAG